MRALRILGIALIVVGITAGIYTFVEFSYSIVTVDGPPIYQDFWFWQGPAIGATVAIIGAVLAFFARTRPKGLP